MDTPGAGGKPPEAIITRRVLLTAGGLTLLSGCATSTAGHLAGPRHPSAPPGGRPGSRSPGATAPSAPPSSRATGTSPDGRGPASGHAPGADGQPLYYVHGGPQAIALTIDDGPSSLYTPQILRLLARYRVTATFSMIGIQARELPAIAREVAAAGHLIANHTWRHLNLALLSPPAVSTEVDRATEAIHAATGVTPTLFRAPYGAWSASVLRYCHQAGMTPVDWSVDPRDWARPGVPAIVDTITRTTRTGSIILEHDGGGDRAQTVEALRIAIPRLLDAGYRFVKI